MSYANGGQNKTDIFRVVDTGSALAAKQLDGTTAAASSADAALRLAYTSKFSPSLVAGAKVNAVWEQIQDDQDFMDLFNAIITPTSAVAAGLPAYELQNAVVINPEGSSSGEKLLIIHYGSLKDGKIKVTSFLGNPSDDFGSFVEAAKEYSAPKVGFNGISAPYEFNIKPLLDTAIVTAPTTYVIPNGACFNISWITVA